MSTKKPFCIIALLLLSLSIFALPQSAATDFSTQSPSQIASMRSPDGPTTRLIREYSLPAIPVSTIAYFGPGRAPFGIAYDSNGYTWITDFLRDTIYRLKPATTLNQTTTEALEYPLNNTHGQRVPYFIIVDSARKVVWFTNPLSLQISRLNWSSNTLDDWYVPNLGIFPFDLVMQQSNVIWFTGFNATGFYKLNATDNKVTAYSISVQGYPASHPTRIGTNGTSLFMTDYKLDRLYEVPFAAITTNPSSHILVANGLSWDLSVDPNNDVWVTQPLTSRINEQLAHSTPKNKTEVTLVTSSTVSPDHSTLNTKKLDVRIELTSVEPAVLNGTPSVIGDPLRVWTLPTVFVATAYVPQMRPWDIATSSDGYAWFTEPWGNHIGAVRPDTNTTLMYLVPTSGSWPVCIDMQPDVGAQPYHVWFTEGKSGKIGELFSGGAADVRVCPSLLPQYPPPSPGSVRWTPGVEIWVDAPSNGYDSSHHDSAERGVTNRLYARVENMGSSTATSIAVKFYWFSNTSASLALNYIPLPPSTPSAAWTQIGSTTIASLAAGSTADVYVDWVIGSDLPKTVTIGVQVSVTGDSNLYDNVGYCNFTLTTPAGAPTFTVPGIAVGFVAGFALMAVVAILARKH